MSGGVKEMTPAITLNDVVDISKQKVYVYDTPSCCGSIVVIFSKECSKNKVDKVCDHIFDTGLMGIVYSPIKLKKSKSKKLAKNIYVVCQDGGSDEDAEDKLMKYSCPPYTDRSWWIKNSKVLTRLVDNLYFINNVYKITDEIVEEMKAILKKGDVLLAISAAQPAARKVLVKCGLKVVSKCWNPHSENKLFLHQYIKR